MFTPQQNHLFNCKISGKDNTEGLVIIYLYHEKLHLVSDKDNEFNGCL